MQENGNIVTGAELLDGEFTIPDVNLTFNGNVQNVNITINHFTNDEIKE